MLNLAFFWKELSVFYFFFICETRFNLFSDTFEKCSMRVMYVESLTQMASVSEEQNQVKLLQA